MTQQKKIGLALSGGAARGIAHIGVLQVLMENNIPISYVTGCSFGSVVGGVYVTGGDMYMLEKIAYALSEKDIFDITVPRMGLMRGKKVENMIMTLTKNKTFEQSNIPFAVGTTDLITGKNVCVREGYIHEAVRASISMPGAFEPVEKGDLLLVDGGITERIPLNAMKEFAPDIVIAVDVGYRGFKRKKPANVFEVLMQSFEVTDWEVTKNKLTQADVVIAPVLDDINPLVVGEFPKCVQKGREAAQAAIEEIRRLLD